MEGGLITFIKIHTLAWSRDGPTDLIKGYSDWEIHSKSNTLSERVRQEMIVSTARFLLSQQKHFENIENTARVIFTLLVPAFFLIGAYVVLNSCKLKIISVETWYF